MKENYAKVIVMGSPITKSNFKLSNSQGRAILPYNSGMYHDRYANYEEQIAYETKIQNPNVVLEEALIAVLKVYYKSQKRHPDTNNITKSIFDGIEKSGLIINDMQIRRLVIEEFYDKENPRFELELFGESIYSVSYSILKKDIPEEKILYSPPANKKKIANSTCRKSSNLLEKNKTTKKSHSNSSNNKDDDSKICSICKKAVESNEYVTANKGQTIICKKCLSK